MKTGECRECGQRKRLPHPPFHSQACATAWAMREASKNPGWRHSPGWWWRRRLNRGG